MPRYEYRCDTCGLTEDRIVPVDDRNEQTHTCSDGTTSPLPKVFSPPRARAVMGARARARAIKDRGLIELGTESYATVQKEAARNYEHQKEMRRSTIERELLDGISEIGDALYTRKPDRPRRLRGPGPDHVGGAAA